MVEHPSPGEQQHTYTLDMFPLMISVTKAKAAEAGTWQLFWDLCLQSFLLVSGARSSRCWAWGHPEGHCPAGPLLRTHTSAPDGPPLTSEGVFPWISADVRCCSRKGKEAELKCPGEEHALRCARLVIRGINLEKLKLCPRFCPVTSAHHPQLLT